MWPECLKSNEHFLQVGPLIAAWLKHKRMCLVINPVPHLDPTTAGCCFLLRDAIQPERRCVKCEVSRWCVSLLRCWWNYHGAGNANNTSLRFLILSTAESAASVLHVAQFNKYINEFWKWIKHTSCLSTLRGNTILLIFYSYKYPFFFNSQTPPSQNNPDRDWVPKSILCSGFNLFPFKTSPKYRHRYTLVRNCFCFSPEYFLFEVTD